MATVWRIASGLDGWRVEAIRRVRSSKSSPGGYTKHVTAPGSPFQYGEALAIRDRLNAAARAKRRRPTPAS